MTKHTDEAPDEAPFRIGPPFKAAALDLAKHYVSDHFDTKDGVMPIVFLFREGSDSIAGVPLSMGDDEDKDHSREVIQFAVNHFRAEASVFIAESWKASELAGKTLDPDNYTPPSEREDREEGVMVIFESKYEGQESMWIPITREPTALGKPEPLPGFDFGGRFTGFFGNRRVMH